MKGVLLRQLQQAPGLVNRLLASANIGAVDCKLVALFTDEGARGMATGADIMCGSSNTTNRQERSNVAEASVSSSTRTAVMEEEPLKASPQGSAKQQWWRPDPSTGTWVPEGYEGQVTTSTHGMKSASRVMRIRSDTAVSLEDNRWWTSMEELPDMDRANPHGCHNFWRLEWRQFNETDHEGLNTPFG